MKKTIRFTAYIVLAAALCLILSACGGTAQTTDLWSAAMYTEDTELGTGSKTLFVDVKAEDRSVTFTIKTDKETVGEALVDNGLVSGEQGPYGLYVKFVNGIEADYNKTQTFWSFTKGGEALQTGVDSTKFSDGEHFELVYTK